VFFQGGYGHFALPRPSAAVPGTGDVQPVRAANGDGAAAASPFEGDWLEELARVTGMDARDLRRYAKSTEGVVNELVGGYVRAFHDECIKISRRPVSAAEVMDELIRAAFGSMEENRVAIMILQNEGQYLATRPEFEYLEPLERAIDHVWLTTLQRGVDEGDFRSGLDVRLAYRFIGDMLFTTARRYDSGRPDSRADSAHMAETCRSMILYGLQR